MWIALEDNDVMADLSSRTPLSWQQQFPLMERSWREQSVKMRLERNDVNPDSVDKTGRKPSSWAFKNGHREIFRKLLDWHDAHPNMGDHRS